jgi:hypothetical protein
VRADGEHRDVVLDAVRQQFDEQPVADLVQRQPVGVSITALRASLAAVADTDRIPGSAAPRAGPLPSGPRARRPDAEAPHAERRRDARP